MDRWETREDCWRVIDEGRVALDASVLASEEEELPEEIADALSSAGSV